MGDKKTSFIVLFFLVLTVIGFSLIQNSNADNSINCNLEYQYRSFNGYCNNLENPLYGSAGVELLRMSGVGYVDEILIPINETRPNPRDVSNLIADQSESVLNKDHASDFIWQWGQFLDHDLDLTQAAEPTESFNIKVPMGDPDFDPFNTGTQTIPLVRSIHNGGTSEENPRQQLNQITAFIDASNVYGSNEITAIALRDNVNPSHLNMTGNGLLPENDLGFIAGDVRANEQIALTAMHTLFVREHNRLADEIQQKHPDFSDEQIYQTARKVVGAEMQVITYQEFLPKLLGPNAIPKYTGYEPSVNPGIANEFSTASFRYGHSQLSSSLLIIDDSGKDYIKLRDAFFNPDLFKETGIDAILLGLASQKSQEIDTLLVDDVRNFLFGPPGAGGFDLASLNIQRGRDHGIPDYNTVRIAYGLEPVTRFDQITSNQELQEKLESVYGDVDNIDLWVGGLAEDHVPNAMVGETIREVLIDQFSRLRDGDRFWYQNDPFFLENKEHMKQVEKITLSDIIKRNTDIDQIQNNVFHYKNFK